MKISNEGERLITLIGGIALLLLGYVFYGRYIENNFVIN